MNTVPWQTSRYPGAGQTWHQAVADVCAPLIVTRRDTRPKASAAQTLYAHPLASMTCFELTSDAGQTFGTHTTTGPGFVFVALQLEGRCTTECGGRRMVLHPHTFAFLDTTNPFVLHYEHGSRSRRWRALLLRIPRDLVVPLLVGSCDISAVAHDGNAGGIDTIAVTTMLSTWNNIDYLERRASNATESALISVLAAAAHSAGRCDGSQTLRMSINSYLADNLRSADLSAAAVARRFAISVRKLHQLYAGTDRSFAQTLMALRVENCAREIAASNGALSLARLAARWGFCDQSHLNRVFRAEYGCLPSEFLRSAASPAGTAAAAG